MLRTALLLAHVHVAVASNNTACALHPGKTAQCGPGKGQCTTIQTISGGDPTSCCHSCAVTPGCDFFVFSGASNECHLKQGDSSYQISYPSCTWGANHYIPPQPPAPPPPGPQQCKFNQGMTAQCGPGKGQCTTIQTISGGDPTSCCHSCAATPGCDFFVFSGASNECHLKQGDSSYQISYPSCTWGAKTSPGPSPPPPGQLPVFNDRASLQQSPWGRYMMSVYGEVPPPTNVRGPCYPIHLANFWGFYKDKLQAQGLSLPPSVGKCPTKNAPIGQHYDENNVYSSKDLTWLWHEPNFPGFDDAAPIEVSHQKDPFGDEHYGMWFQYAKGSGIYISIGKTKVFNDHEDAFDFFGAKDSKILNINEDMSQKAAAKGYDTVQFIKHRDDINYPCAKQMGVKWMNMEIVAVKLKGTYSCGQAQGTPSQLRAGWQGIKPCVCDPSNPNTNCVWSLANTTGVEYV